MNLTFRHYYWRWLKNQVFLFFMFAALMSLARASFALYFGELTTLKIYSHELKKAFWLGFRFDLMPLAYINVLPFILINIGFFLKGKKTIKLLRFMTVFLLTTGYFALIWLYISDYGFYSYFQEHLNILFFGFFEDDTKALIITIWKNYNVPFWLFILAFVHYGLYRFIRFLFSPFEFDLKARPFNLGVPFTFLLGLTLIAFMGRGNFTRLPLSVEDAFISNNEFVNEVALNGALTLNRAIKIRKTFGKGSYDYLQNFGFKDWKDAFSAFKGEKPNAENVIFALTTRTPKKSFLKENPPHVVLVVMESFGSYWNDKESKDFQILGDLSNHFEKGILFKNFLPAENGTIGSIVSIATAQPIRPGARFLSESEYMNTNLASSGHLPFKYNGYETHFLYGGKLGWRDLGKFLKIQGYDKLWGADEIRESMPELENIAPGELGNEWGIFDEYLYAFIDEQIRTSRRPQFFLVLTTSNHPPFEYPSSYKPRPLILSDDLKSQLSVSESLGKKRFLAMQYANQKMADFLTRIQTSPYGDKTIVALTGDHSFWISKGVGLDEEFKRFAVPFFLSIPEAYLPAHINTQNFGSHEDIFPTLVNLSLSDTPYVELGRDLFSQSSFALNSSGLTANEEGAYHHEKFWKWLNLEKQILQETGPTPSLEELRRKGLGQIGLTDVYLKAEKNRKLSDEESDRQ